MHRFLHFTTLACLFVLEAATACPFCNSQGQTLAGEVSQADMIVVGVLKNARRDPDDISRGTTDMDIETVVKPHDYLGNRRSLVIPRYVPLNPNEKDVRFILFCNLYPKSTDTPAAAIASTLLLGNPKSLTLDAYRGEPLPANSKLAEYLAGARDVRDKDAVARLRFFFNYLDASELLVGSDAYMEFGNTDYKDVRKLAESLPAAKLSKWLEDKNTPPSRLGLYGLLLGHCGTKKDAELLRKIVSDKSFAYSSGLDGMMAGLLMLEPQDGWKFVLGLTNDRKLDFNTRMAALKVMRFVHDYRPDLVKPPQLMEGMKRLVQQSDMADLPIEDLRKWQAWDQTEFVLSFAEAESHKINIVRRAILRFAITAAPHNQAAAAYAEKVRKSEPDRVKLVEEMLADENPRPTPKK